RYNQAVQTVPAEYATLQKLLAPRQTESGNLARLKNLVDQKFAELRETIDLRRRRGEIPAIDLVLSDVGKRTMDEIRSICSEIQHRENAAQSEDSLARQAAALTALLVTIGGSLLLLFFFAAGVEPILSREPKMLEK